MTRQSIATLPDSGPTDPIRYYKKPLVGRLYRERINMGLRLIEGERFARLLEIGYGAGAVLLTLDGVADEMYGIDLDADPARVGATLRGHGCDARLSQGDVCSLPYTDDFFDLAVSFSVFEHLHGYRRALAEVARTLRTGGTFVLGMPAVSRLMSMAFRAIGFSGIEDHHVTTPADVARSFLDAGFRPQRSRYLGPRFAPLYTVWRLIKVDAPSPSALGFSPGSR